MPTISIITTVYDAKDYLPRTVQSILDQSFSDFELILVEDGSPNGCGELCDELAKTDPRIRVVHKPNGGPASASNAGLNAAQGRYIGFVDSDDLLHPDFLKTLYSNIQQNDCRIAACAAGCVDENNNPIDRAVRCADDLLGRQDAVRQFYDIFRDKGMYAMVTWNKLFDAKLFENVRFDESFFFGDDANILDKVYPGVPIHCSNETLYYYRVHSGSLTASQFSPRTLDDLRLYGGWVDFFAARPEYADLARRAEARYWEVFYIFYVHASEAGSLDTDLKADFARYKKKLVQLLPRILKTPYLPAFEKVRALLFCASPALCYRLAALWGRLVDRKG